jgi:hypothetical protein
MGPKDGKKRNEKPKGKAGWGRAEKSTSQQHEPGINNEP